MIDVEPQVFTKIATALRTQYSNIFVADEYVPKPEQMPAVCIMEMDNTAQRKTQDSASMENTADVMYQVDVYSNRVRGKKAECKAIAATIDEMFVDMGFTRMGLNPIPNMNDATIYRMTGRYRAVVDKNNTIYRR